MSSPAIYLYHAENMERNIERDALGHLLPGSRNALGNKGGGRRPNLFKRHLRECFQSEKAQLAMVRVLEDENHDHYPSVLKLAMEYVFGKATANSNVKIDQTINVVYDTKPQRSVQDALRSHESIEAIPVPQEAPALIPESI